MASFMSLTAPWPKLSPAAAQVMKNVATTLDQSLGAQLNPSRTPSNVRYFQSPDGNSQGSVVMRSGKTGSKVHFMLDSWLHSALPFGTLNIGTLIVMVNSEVDTPHFMLELIMSTNTTTKETSLVLSHDLLPRKDLVLEPEYLKRYYQETNLDHAKQKLLNSPDAKIYVPPSLFIRSVLSPTSLMFQFKGTSEEKLDSVIRELVAPCVVDNVLIWLHSLQKLGKVVTDQDRELLTQRDERIQSLGVEVDLSSNLPKLFGHEISDLVIAAFRKGE